MATAKLNLPQGDQRILLEPRGARRLSSQSLLDLRVSRTLRSTRGGSIELLLDVFNALKTARRKRWAATTSARRTSASRPLSSIRGAR